jgi:hypothetical protein
VVSRASAGYHTEAIDRGIDDSSFHLRTAVIHTRFWPVRSFVALSVADAAITHPYRRRTMFHSILSVLHTDASHFIAALLVMFYASGRFNTPRSVRSQTSRFQYFGSCVTYVLSCEGILFALTWALQQQQPDILNLLHVGAEGPLQSDVVGLQTPLLAALMLTTLLPSFPMLRDVDVWMLKLFHRMGDIPVNAARWTRQLEFAPFTIMPINLVDAQNYIEMNPALPNSLVAQFTTDPKADKIRYGFTRVVVLYAALQRRSAWDRFADAFPDDVPAFEKKMGAFFAHCVGYFALSGQLSKQNLEPAVDAADDIAKFIAESDFDVRSMLARVLLYSCNNESAMVSKLRDIGFSMDRRIPISVPYNLLAFDLFGVVVLFLVAMWFSTSSSAGQMPVGRAFTTGLLVAVNHSIAAAFALLPKQLWSFADRSRAKERPGLAYVISGLCTLTVALSVSYCVYVLRVNFTGHPAQILPFAAQCKWLLLSMGLSMALAFACDDCLGVQPEPKWLRFAEGAGIAALMAGIGFVVAQWIGPDIRAIHTGDQSMRLVLPVALSGSIGALFGVTIPHWYRNSVSRAVAPVGRGAGVGTVGAGAGM